MKLTLIGHSDLGGHGDGSQIDVCNDQAAVAHMGSGRAGTTLLDISQPHRPAVVGHRENPVGTHSHKVSFLGNGDLLVVNQERNDLYEPDPPSWAGGLAVVDATSPDLEELARLDVAGKGVHRMTVTQDGTVLMSASSAELAHQHLAVGRIDDGPTITLQARWWLDGMGPGEEKAWPDDERWVMHHANILDDLAYCSWWDGGFVVIDISDRSRPRPASIQRGPVPESMCTHSVLPLPAAGLCVIVDEQTERRGEIQRRAYLCAMEGSVPGELVAVLPEPPRPTPAYGRFGPHNIHEMPAGSFQSDRLLFVTYFSGGLVVYDVSDPLSPQIAARFHPGDSRFQANDVFVTEAGLVLVTDRFSDGLYLLQIE